MSSTIKRGNTWTAYWYVSDPATGKRKQYSKSGFKLQKDAKAHLATVVTKVNEGSWNPEKLITVKSLLVQHWLPTQKSNGLRQTTIVQYRNVISAWIVPHLGGVKVVHLTPEMVTDWVDTLSTATTAKGREGLSPRSRELSVGVLKAACAWAFSTHLINHNPISGVKRPKSNSKVMRSWSVDEARQFLDRSTDDPLRWAWTLLLTRGLRRGELCGLRWQDVSFEGASIMITHTRVTAAGKAVESEPKTRAGRRSIPLDASLTAILRTHRTSQSRDRLKAGGAYEDSGYLLADELGCPYHPDSISGWFDDRVKASGLPRIRLHDTRHTVASLMLASGVPVKVVSEMLGHADPAITLNTYQHVMPGMSSEAGAALSASLLG